MTSHNQNLQAIVIVCISYLGFSIADTFSKMLAQTYHVHQILAYTGLVGVAVSGAWVFYTLGWSGFIPREKGKWHIVRALCVAGIPISVISALQHLPLADYYGISFCSPFLILALSALLLREKVGIWRWAAVIVGFCGVMIIAGPQFNQGGIGVVFAFSAALFVALSVITVRKIGAHAPRPYYIFFPFVATWIINMIALPIFGEYKFPDMDDMVKFIALIIFVMASQLGFALGHARASEAAVTAPFLYTQVIWGVLFGWLVFHDFPQTSTWAGLAVVIGAGLFSFWREWHLHRAIRSVRGAPPLV